MTIDEVHPGDRLPDLCIPITTTLVVAGALAARDYTPVHHDRAAAQAAGVQDVFMNILTTNGLVGRYVTDWAGPAAILRRVAIRLGAPNLPGDTMTMRGTVAARDEATATVDVEVEGRNGRGSHVTARVCVTLPRAT